MEAGRVMLHKKGWKQDDSGEWYYVEKDGTLCTELQKINGKTYYFDDDGRMLKASLSRKSMASATITGSVQTVRLIQQQDGKEIFMEYGIMQKTENL